MLCMCIRFRLRSKTKSVSGDVGSARQGSTTSEWSFHRSNAPSPPERTGVGAVEFSALAVPDRESIMEPNVNAIIQARENIDKITLFNTTI